MRSRVPTAFAGPFADAANGGPDRSATISVGIMLQGLPETQIHAVFLGVFGQFFKGIEREHHHRGFSVLGQDSGASSQSQFFGVPFGVAREVRQAHHVLFEVDLHLMN